MIGGYDSTEYFTGRLPKDADGNTVFSPMTEEEYEKLLLEPQNEDLRKRIEYDRILL